MFDFSYSPDQNAIREEIKSFAKTYLNDNVIERDYNQVFSKELWSNCGTIGLPGLCIPEEYGGRGLSALDTTIALESLGSESKDMGFNFSIAAHLLACAMPIHIYGSEFQKQNILPDLCNGTNIASNAMTEITAGSDVYDMASSLVQNDMDYILNGHKSYCSNGPVADIVLTYAANNKEKGFFGGVTAIVLQKEHHSFKCSDPIEKVGLRTCQMGEMSFSDIKIEQQDILSKVGAGGPIFQRSMDWERICLGALHLGSMDRLMKKAVGFIKKRKSGGKAIKNYQAVTHPLVDLQCRIESARLIMYKAACKLDQNKNVSKEASMCKLMISETYKDFGIQLNQLFAGEAFRSNNDIERCLRDALASTIYSGTSEIHRNILTRYL